MNTYPLVLADSATMLRRNLRRMRRYPSLTFFIAGIPVVFLLLFVYVLGGTLGAGLGGVAGGRAEYTAYVLPGILLVTVAGAAQGTAISIAMDMTEGIIARFRTMAIGRIVGPDRPRRRQRHPDDAGARHRHGRRPADRLPADDRSGRVARGGRPPRPRRAGHLLAVGRPGHVGQERRDREQPADVPGPPAVPEQRLRPDGLDAGGLSWFAENQPFTPIIETVRGLLLGTPIGNSGVLAVGWCVGISIVGYLWARRLYDRDSDGVAVRRTPDTAGMADDRAFSASRR